MKHALSIDIEDYFQVAAFDDVVDSKSWATIDSRVEIGTHRFMDIMDKHNTHATFFILGWVAEKLPALVREIANRGHEIACHGYSHQLVYNQKPNIFQEETNRSKKLLEDITQAEVVGYRAASYSITKKSLWALEIIQDAGFRYDSSIYPVKHDRYGLQGGPHTPYQLQLTNGRSLLEFPITTVKLMGYHLPVGGGGYFRIYPYRFTKCLLKRRTKQYDAPFVFYLHPWELDPDQPRIESATALSRFRHYHNLNKVEKRLRRLMRVFEFDTMQSILAEMDTPLPSHTYC